MVSPKSGRTKLSEKMAQLKKQKKELPTPKMLTIPNSVATAATTFINLKKPHIYTLDAEARVSALAELAMSAHRMSDQQLYEQIALAYALAVSEPANLAVMNSIAKKMNMGSSARRDRIRFYLELLISYGDSGRNREDVLKLHSRDARAVMYLLNNGISPSGVAMLAQKSGEGVDAWAKRFKARESTDKKIAAPTERRKTHSPRTAMLGSVKISFRNGTSQAWFVDEDYARSFASLL